LVDGLAKPANGATDLSDGNSAETSAPTSAPAPRHQGTAVLSGVQDKLTAKLGMAGAANSGGDGSSDSGHADSGGATK
jgi:hypothetical protein